MSGKSVTTTHIAIYIGKSCQTIATRIKKLQEMEVSETDLTKEAYEPLWEIVCLRRKIE